MASCLWIYPCLLCIVFTFVATDELNDNTTCTFTNNVDCSHLLNQNNTKEYKIENKEINRTGVKIIFETERGIQFLRLISGEELVNRIKQINITRGSHNHLVNLSCSKKEKIKLEPVVVSKEIQIDFVEGCSNDTDPIVIKNIQYKYMSDEDDFFQNTSEMTALSEEPFETEEFITADEATADFRETTEDPLSQGMKPVPTSLGSKTRFMTTGKTMEETNTERKDDDDFYQMPLSSEKPFKKTSNGKQMKSKTTGEESERKPIPTSPVTKMRLMATGKPVTKKTEMEKKGNKKESNFKVGASRSSAQKISRDVTCLFLVLCLFYIA